MYLVGVTHGKSLKTSNIEAQLFRYATSVGHILLHILLYEKEDSVICVMPLLRLPEPMRWRFS